MTAAVPSQLRARIYAKETLLGSFVNMASPVATEIMGIAGLDWLIIDLEHGAGDEHVLIGQLQTLSGTGTEPLVRVEGIEPARILHALDMGATGVVVPRLRSAEDARRCAEYCRYGGSRGVARYNRSWHWGTATRDPDEVDAEVVCAVQIETAEALAAVDEIAAVDGVDVLFVGPADLAHSLGMRVPPDDPALLARVETVAHAAAAHGKAAGMLVATIEQVRAYRAIGFSFLGCSSDSSLLALAARRLADELTAAAAEPSRDE